MNTANSKRHVLGAALLLGVLAGCGGGSGDSDTATAAATAPAAAAAPTAAEQCVSLSGMSIPASGIGLATGGAIVQSAQLIASEATGNANGEYCKVLGAIRPVDASAPNILFQANLPSNWNSKLLQQGGGGLDGSIVTGEGTFTSQPASVPGAIKQGYVTYGSDSGHQGTDAGFALNDESLANFGRLQIKKTHDAVAAVVKARYGSAVKKSYFIGGSQGGHESLIAAHFYPEDYDGVVAGYPAYNVTMMHVASSDFSKALYANGGIGWISPAKMALIYNTTMGYCDALDGVADGIVGNPNSAACTTLTGKLAVADSTNPLRCPGGADTGNTCLSDAQIATVARLNSRFNLGFTISGGISSYGKWPLLDGSAFVTESLGATAAYTSPPGNGDAFQYRISDTTARYIITRNLSLDTVQNFVPSAWTNRIIEVSNLLDANNVNLDAFKAKGGKVIMFHGSNDSSITPYNSIDYYTRILARYTQSTLDTFYRFYLIPGFGHGSGQFRSAFDSLGALDAWVSQDVAPGKLVTSDANTTASTAATNGRTRPLCVYGTYPRYTGPASPSQTQANDAANFTCTAS